MSKQAQDHIASSVTTIELQDWQPSSSGEGTERKMLVQAGPAPRRPAPAAVASSSSASTSAFFPVPPLLKIVLLGIPEYKRQVLDMGSSRGFINTVGIDFIAREYAGTKFQMWDIAYSVLRMRALVQNQLLSAQALLIVPDTVDTLQDLYRQASEANCPVFWMEVELPHAPRPAVQKEALNEAAAQLSGLVKLEATSFESVCLSIQEAIVEKRRTAAAPAARS